MSKEAIKHYHDLLADSDLAASSLQMLDAELDRTKLIFGGRRLTPYLRPHFVTQDDWTRITQTCETIFGALQKVKDAAVADDKILDELGVTEIERELVHIDPGYSHVSPTSRLDSFLAEDAYSYVELNGESPAGIAYSDSASEIFASLPVMKKFAEKYDIQRLEGRSKMNFVALVTHGLSAISVYGDTVGVRFIAADLVSETGPIWTIEEMLSRSTLLQAFDGQAD